MTQLNLPLLLPSVAQMVEDFASTAGQPKDVLMARRLVREEYKEWEDEVNDSAGKPENELKELADLIYVVYGYARAKGYDLEGAVQAVHDNNMGRMWHPCSTCSTTSHLTRKCDDCGDRGYTIKRRDDGKVIKNPSYPKVDLSPYVP